MKVQLNPSEKVAAAAYVTLGAAGLPMCYKIVNPTSQAREDVFLRQAQRWAKSQMVQDYITTIAPSIRRDGDEALPPPTKEQLIAELQKALKASIEPSERASIALKLADLMGVKGKQPDGRDEREQRKFYLPYVSKCRTCQIYQIFKKIMHDP